MMVAISRTGGGGGSGRWRMRKSSSNAFAATRTALAAAEEPETATLVAFSAHFLGCRGGACGGCVGSPWMDALVAGDGGVVFTSRYFLGRFVKTTHIQESFFVSTHEKRGKLVTVLKSY
jgi:hypothetical protein